jgi:hypothetical protein
MKTINNIPVSNLVLDISNIEVTIPVTKKSLNDLVEILLESIPLPTYELTVDEMIWIQTFIKTSPLSIQKIATDIQEIIQDGKIDSHDIPAIIRLIADIYKSNAIKIEFINAQNIITLVKFTINVILQSELLILPNIEKKVIQSMINSSLELLSMKIDNIVEIKKKWLYWC